MAFWALHVEIDWEELGWDDASDAVGDFFQASCSRGFSGAAANGFVASPGGATITLYNRDGKYSRHNAASPYFGHLQGKKPLRLRLEIPSLAFDQVVWTGRTDKLRAGRVVDGAPTAVLTCVGTMARLTDGRKVTPVGSPGDTYDALLASLFSAAGLTTQDYDLAPGEVESGVWSPANVEPLAEAKLVVGTELGRLYEMRDGVLAGENRHYRRDTARSNSVQLTLSDDPDDDPDPRFQTIDLSDPEENVYDRVVVDFTPMYTVDGAPTEIFWMFGGGGTGQGIGDIIIPPGGSRTITVNPFAYPFLSRSPDQDLTDTPGRYIVTSWQTPTVSGLDPDIGAQGSPYAEQASLSISNVVTNAHSITFTLTNSDPTLGLYISYIRLLGTRGVTGARVQEVVGAGYREYPLPSPYYPEAGSAQTAARWLYDYYSPPRDLLTLTVPALRSPELLRDLLQREISDRVHVVGVVERSRLALDDDFFFEGERWEFTRDRNVLFSGTYSACLPDTHDTSEETGLPTGTLLYYPFNEASGLVHVDVISGEDLTRHGNVSAPGLIGPGQQFVATEFDRADNDVSGGVLDDTLTGDWEWNGWIKRGADTAADQIILQKDHGATPAYTLRLYRLDATHFYLSGLIHTTDGDFEAFNASNLIPTDTWCFVRMLHDSVAKTISVSAHLQGVALAGMASVTYTGDIVTDDTGVVFGGDGSHPFEPADLIANFDYWFRAYDLAGANGANLDTWPDISGNGRDATWPTLGNHPKILDGGLGALRVVDMNDGKLQFSEIGLNDCQVFMVAKVTATTSQGTMLRTSATPGPNYGIGYQESFGTYRLYGHMYSSGNSGPFKRQEDADATLGSWHLYTLIAEYGTSALAINVDGVPVTLEANGSNLSGASGIAPDGAQVTMDVGQIIIAHGLTAPEIGQLETYLMDEAGL